jgi:putative flippase GtrA
MNSAVSHRRRIPKFIIVGGIGFCINAGTLSVAHEIWGVGLRLAAVVAFTCAVFTTWAINRTWVFAASRTKVRDEIGREGLRYLFVQTGSSALTLLMFQLLIGLDVLRTIHPVAILALAALAGMIVSYLGSTFFVFSGGAVRRSATK